MELKNNQELTKGVQTVQDELLEIIDQLELCGYACQGGPLELNVAFIRLKEIAHGGIHTKLDRSWWEGCKLCQEALFVKRIQYLRPATAPLTQEQEIMDKLAELTGTVYCKLEHRFCPMCGRPLTEEAWAELERRIGGNDGTDDR